MYRLESVAKSGEGKSRYSYPPHVILPRFPLQNHSFTRAIQSTITTCNQVPHLVRRVVKRRGGLDECRANQLVTAFALNKILYSLPYCTLTQTQMHRIQSALNTLYKAALHLPTHASTAKLYATGLFLPLAEHLRLHRDRQHGRLSRSAQGHWLLQRAGIQPIDFPLYTAQRPLPSNIRCAPIPSNMSLHLHEGRRQACAHFHEPSTSLLPNSRFHCLCDNADPPPLAFHSLPPLAPAHFLLLLYPLNWPRSFTQRTN